MSIATYSETFDTSHPTYYVSNFGYGWSPPQTNDTIRCKAGVYSLKNKVRGEYPFYRVHPYTHIREVAVGTGYGIKWMNWSLEYGYIGLIPPPTLSILPSDAYFLIPASLYDDAISKCKTKLIKKAGPAIQSLISVGEGKKTVKMFADRANLLLNRHETQLVKTYGNGRYMKQLNRLSPETMAKRLSEMWLEYSFGIQPTISDLQGAAVAVAKEVLRLEIKHFRAQEELDSRKGVYTTQTGGEAHRVTVSEVYEDYLKVCCGGTYTFDARSAGSNLENWGLTAPNVVPAIWELIPYSWLVDYFTNASEIIDAAVFNSALLSDQYISVLWNRRYRAEFLNPVQPDGHILRLSYPGSHEIERAQFTRSLMNLSNFAPSIEFEIPSLRKLSNALALAASKTFRLQYRSFDIRSQDQKDRVWNSFRKYFI